MTTRLLITQLALGLLIVGACGKAAHGDGGTIRLSRCEGRYRISVFTAPTPCRAGPVDISVLVQDAVTGELIPDVSVTVSTTLRTRPVKPEHHVATSEAATNKLLKAAVFELPEAGRWAIDVGVEKGQERAGVHFELWAAGRLPKWPAMWLWIGWPAPVVLLFSIHQLLVWRKRHRPA